MIFFWTREIIMELPNFEVTVMKFMDKNSNWYLVAPSWGFIWTLILSDMDFTHLKQYSLLKRLHRS